MPILEVNKARYPSNWKDISKRIREERAGNKCETCGVENHRLVRRFGPGVNDWEYWPEGMQSESYSLDGYKSVKIILTVAHLDHTPENCDDANLLALCQKCHNNYDKDHRKGTRRETRYKDQSKLF